MKILNLAFEQYYLPGKPVLPLVAACELSVDGDIERACVSDKCEELLELFAQGEGLDQIAATLGIAVLDFSAPLHLQPVYIPKPWGQEIWYTGIEARGVSQVVSDSGTTPLSWAIAIDRQRLLGAHTQPNLLKILDPLPDEVYGDLYFELHEQKREVYIVTHVDERAWPSGVGAIRFGFSAEKRALYSGDSDFIAAYRAAVSEYRAVRHYIDSELDSCRQRKGIGLNEPVGAELVQQWLQKLPDALQQQERDLRHAMESFTALRELRVGDVLAVPLHTPHALQHGVRTVEFQTPVYERKILSFAQKVLTQDHWDTDEALQIAQLQMPQDEQFPVLCDSGDVKIEQIVQFDDFIVRRIMLAPGASCVCETAGNYLLLMAVDGRVVCDTKMLEAEQASLVPACVESVLLQNPFAGRAELLLAMPG